MTHEQQKIKVKEKNASIKNPKKKKNNNSKPNNAGIKEVLLQLAALILSLFIESCVIFYDDMGTVGAFICNLMLGLFGSVTAFILPLATAALAFFWKRLKTNGVCGRKLIFTALSALLLSAVVQLATSASSSPSFGEAIKTFWTEGTNGIGGGVLGGALAMGLNKLLGKVAGLVIASFAFAVLLSFVLGFTGVGIWGFALSFFEIGSPSASGNSPKKSSSVDRGGNTLPTSNAKRLRIAASSAGSSEVAEIRSATVSDELNIEDDGSGYDGNGKRTSVSASVSAKPNAQKFNNNNDIIATADIGIDDTDDIDTDETINTNELSANLPELGANDTEEAYDQYDQHDEENNLTVDDENSDDEEFLTDTGDDAADSDELDFTAGEFSTIKKVSSSSPSSPLPNPVNEEEDDGVLRWKRGNKYHFPSTELLNKIEAQNTMTEEQIQKVADKILRKLASFRVSAELVGYSVGPSITRYELFPGEGVRVKSISQLLDDISLELASEGVRIEAPIPGKSAVGVEVPNQKVSLVSFRSLAEDPAFKKAKSKITVCIGLNITGAPVFMDIDDMPHVLIAGQTKSGKSVAINCMILSLLFRVTPDEVKLILIDPKQVELSIYSKLPHLVMPVVDEAPKAAAALSWAVKEMERRYTLMKKFGARNRDEYRAKTASDPERDDFPQIVIIIDELADLMLQVREHVEPLINRLAAKARACGIHLLIGTQRPSVDVLTGLIKANIPARISFKVAEQVDSKTILGGVGAEKLIGRGDMLYQATGAARIRVQGAFVTGDEISRVVNYIVENNGEASYDPDIMAQVEEEAKVMCKMKKRGGDDDMDMENEREKKKDPLFYNAVEIAVSNQSVATSFLQRHLEIGYGRAAKLIDTMERMGIVGPPNGSKPREVLMTMDQYQVWRLDQRFEDD